MTPILDTYTVAEQRAIDTRARQIIRVYGISRAIAFETAETELEHGLLAVGTEHDREMHRLEEELNS